MPFGIEQKKWENFWYYYKIHVFVGIFAAILVIVTIRDCMTNISPDVTLAYTGPFLGTEQVDAFQKEFSAVIQDVNNDGKKYLLLVPTMNDIQKLQVLIVARDVQLLILNQQNFEAYGKQGAFQPLDAWAAQYKFDEQAHPEIRFTPEEQAEAHIYALPLTDNQLLKKLGLDGKNLYLAMLIEEPAPDAKKAAIYANAHAVLEKILSDAP